MALLAMLAVVMMGVAYALVDRLHAASRFVAVDRDHNAKVLNRAKQALVGYVAQRAATAGENNPGRLPCPEPGAFFGDPAQEGIAAGNCTLPAVGRLPWRTLGLDKLVDANAEPLWYVVSPGWALSNSTVPPLQTLINSDSPGQITVDGAANAAVALIIAPGQAVDAQACGGSPAWVQSRPTAGPPDLRNYLECDNATWPANAAFVTVMPGSSFNDQVLRVTTADVIPALEAAIADRMQREIAPVLRTVFHVTGASQWGTTAVPVYGSPQWGTPSTNPLYPYAAPFGNPGPGSGTSDYAGATGTYQGLLPFNQILGCTASASNPRCLPSLVQYEQTPAPAVEVFGNGDITSQTCSWVSTTDVPWVSTDVVRECWGEYGEDSVDPSLPIRIEMTATFNNVTMGLRALNSTRMQVHTRNNNTALPWLPWAMTYTATINDGSISGRPRGSVTIKFGATMPNIDDMGWGGHAHFRLRHDRAVIDDHALLNPDDTNLGWFVRNEWFRVVYYAAAQTSTAAGLPSHGCSSSNCLRFNNPATQNIRSLLVLAGRSLSNPAGRPNNTLADYVEYQNVDLGTMYEQRPMRMSKVSIPALNAPWNDRLILVDWVAPNPTFPLATLP